MLDSFSVLAQGTESMVVRLAKHPFREVIRWAKHGEVEEAEKRGREGRREGEKNGGVNPEFESRISQQNRVQGPLQGLNGQQRCSTFPEQYLS